jgi:hypothetical protein
VVAGDAENGRKHPSQCTQMHWLMEWVRICFGMTAFQLIYFYCLSLTNYQFFA